MQDGFEEAFSGKPTAELEGKARAIREYLEAFYDEYIDKNPALISASALTISLYH